jgi:protein SDA1
MLKKQDRGKEASMGIRSGERKERRFGEEDLGGIEGIELLEQWKEEERRRKREARGLPDGTAEVDGESEEEEDEGWAAWEVDEDDSDDSGGWINVESDDEIIISDSDDGKPATKKQKLEELPENGAGSKGKSSSETTVKVSTLATTRVCILKASQ